MIARYARDKRKTYRVENTIYTHIIIGDSNAVGAQGKTNLLAANYQGPKAVKIYFKPDRTLADNGSVQPFEVGVNHNRTLEISNNQCGLEVPLAYKLAEYQPNKHFLIKYGLGGSEAWQNTGVGEDDWHKLSNELYNEFLNYVAGPAFTKIYASGFTPLLKSITISLGTNDAGSLTGGDGDAFYTSLTSLCTNLKTDLNAKLRTVFGNPAGDYLGTTKWLILQPPPFAPRVYLSSVRDSTRNFVNGRSTGTPLTAFPNSYLIDCDLCARASDNTHYVLAGYRQMADLVFPLIK